MELKNITKKYKSGSKSITVLDNVSINFKIGKFYAITGHSGSGKTTLIKVLGLIEKIDSGEYYIDGEKINIFNDKIISKIRKEKIGYIFQDYYLNEYMTALENVMIPLYLNKKLNRKERYKYALYLLDMFGLKDRANHFPKKLSGGECQRVAIARALANSPKYLLCDEPTGALDSKNEKKVFEYLKNLTKNGICVIVVSHSKDVIKYADKIYEIEEGKIKEIKK